MRRLYSSSARPASFQGFAVGTLHDMVTWDVAGTNDSTSKSRVQSTIADPLITRFSLLSPGGGADKRAKLTEPGFRPGKLRQSLCSLFLLCSVLTACLGSTEVRYGEGESDDAHDMMRSSFRRSSDPDHPHFALTRECGMDCTQPTAQQGQLPQMERSPVGGDRAARATKCRAKARTVRGAGRGGNGQSSQNGRRCIKSAIAGGPCHARLEDLLEPGRA